jgi:hypothetical protein
LTSIRLPRIARSSRRSASETLRNAAVRARRSKLASCASTPSMSLIVVLTVASCAGFVEEVELRLEIGGRGLDARIGQDVERMRLAAPADGEPHA